MSKDIFKDWEERAKVNTSKTTFPKKDDVVQMSGSKELGRVLDDDFMEVQWANGDIEEWAGMWGSFVDAGGKVVDKQFQLRTRKPRRGNNSNKKKDKSKNAQKHESRRR
jgi:hypothetical protein